MEHFLQFAVNIDDDTIVKRIQENAEKTITKELKTEIGKNIFSTDYYGRPTDRLSEWSASFIEVFLEKYKDQIIEAAANALAEKLLRTKAVKEMVGRLDYIEIPGMQSDGGN